MNLLFRLPIKFQLRLIVIIMALPVVGLIFNAGLQQRKDAMSTASRDTQKLADSIAYEQQIRVTSARQLMVALSQMPEIKQKDSAKVTELLSEIHKLNPDISNIFIADRSGTVWATAVPVKPPFIIYDRRYFKNALSRGQLSSGEFVISRAINRPTFNFSYPIKDEHGEINGVISVGFLLEKYLPILERSKLPKGASFTLLDHKGVILYRGREPEKYIGKPTNPAQFEQIQNGPDYSTNLGVSVASGDNRVITTCKLRLEGESSPYMYIRAGIPVESVYMLANEQLLKNLVLFGLVFVLAFLFSSFIGKRSIINRLNVLENASQALADGNYNTKAAELVQGGELGRLAESFDSMASKLIQKEEKLRESEYFFKESQRAGSIGSYKANFVTGVWESSEVLNSIFGLDDNYDHSITGWINIMHPEDRNMMEAYLREEVISNRKPFAKEYRIIRNNDGETRWVNGLGTTNCDAAGNVISLIGTVQDITERKLANEAQFESEIRFSSIFNSSPVAIGVGEIETGRVIEVNDAWLNLYGFGRDEVIGRNVVDLGIYALCEGRDSIIKAVEEKGFVVNHPIKSKRKSGEIIDVLYSAQIISINSKPCLQALTTDVTDIRRAEKERASLEQQLLHAQKLESLGVLAGGIAHDFNNILMAIIGNADLALMRIEKESPAADNLHKIEQAATRAADLSKQMLAYSGRGKFIVEIINLNHLLQDMLQILEVSISKKAELRFNLFPQLPSVEADATQMRQIVMNLVINASEAIGDKSGVIAITTGCMDCDKSYLKDVWLDENLTDGLYVYLEVADNGCGMDKEIMTKLFDPFFTTKFTGRGLGMAAVLGIVRGHKGAIKVYSEPKKGSTFKILLPASIRPIEIFNHDNQRNDWQGNGIVLLVDDEETVRGIGTEMLMELGFSVITAEDGRDAVEKFKETPDIAFVILDLTMPHMDGVQCFMELRQLKSDIKVIMSSGFNEQDITQKFAGKGLAGFIQKPYKLSVLKEIVKKL